MTDAIRCLAVRQPWAWAIVAGAKDIENRSWQTKYRGQVIIQASATKQEVNQLKKSNKGLPELKVPYGALIGVVDLIDIVPLDKKLENNPWAWGPYCWEVDNARIFKKALPIKGKLNLYRLPSNLTKRVETAISTAQPFESTPTAEAWINAMTTHEDEHERLTGLLGSYLELEDHKNSLRLADRCVAKWGEPADHLHRAYVYLQVEDLETGLAELDEAIRGDAKLAHAYFIRSLVRADLNKMDEACKDQSSAIRLDPAYEDYYKENPLDG